MKRTTNTRTPDRAIPNPTPPNPHPARNWDCPRRCACKALTAIMKTRALAMPATSRRANQMDPSWVVGMSAKVAMRTTNDVRITAAERTTPGMRIPASAPIRYPT